AGRDEIAIAGRVFTENVGIERMVQNLVGGIRCRYLIVCGRESNHRVGQTIFALHRSGLDAAGRVIGSEAPEPLLPNLPPEQLHAFQSQIVLVDMIGVEDAEAIVAKAGQLLREPAIGPEEWNRVPASVAPESATAGSETSAAESGGVEAIAATPDRLDAWEYDPAGFFLIFVDRAARRLRAEQYSQSRRLLRVFEGHNAQALCHTITRHGQVTLLAHAAYLGRELAKAETALRLDLVYEQELPLRRREDGPAGG